MSETTPNWAPAPGPLWGWWTQCAKLSDTPAAGRCAHACFVHWGRGTRLFYKSTTPRMWRSALRILGARPSY